MSKSISFQQWVSTQALGEKIPFSVIGSIPKRWAKVEKAEIAGMSFPILKTLLTREIWFKEFIARNLGNKRMELQIGMYALAKKLRDYAPHIIDSDSMAIKELSALLTGQRIKKEEPTEGSDTEAEESDEDVVLIENESLVEAEVVVETREEILDTFCIAHIGDFQNLLCIMQSMSDETMAQMLQVTFFIASRADTSWDFSDTTTLLPDELEAIKAFISLEMNGGVVQAENTLVQAEEEESLGEELAA